jgi:hypothetical protein
LAWRTEGAEEEVLFLFSSGLRRSARIPKIFRNRDTVLGQAAFQTADSRQIEILFILGNIAPLTNRAVQILESSPKNI